MKTGSTSLALYNLSASATRNGLSLIAVIMKAPTTKLRFSEAQKLLDYGFNNYSYKELAKKDSIIKKVNITKGIENELNATYKEDFGTLLKKGDDKNISQNISLSENLSAPILKNQKIRDKLSHISICQPFRLVFCSGASLTSSNCYSHCWIIPF